MYLYNTTAIHNRPTDKQEGKINIQWANYPNRLMVLFPQRLYHCHCAHAIQACDAVAMFVLRKTMNVWKHENWIELTQDRAKSWALVLLLPES